MTRCLRSFTAFPLKVKVSCVASCVNIYDITVFSVQMKVVAGATLFNGQPIYNDSTQAMRLNRKDPSDITYEDHFGLYH